MWKQTVNVPAYKARITVEIDKPEDEVTGLEMLQMLFQAASEIAEELRGSSDEPDVENLPDPPRLPRHLQEELEAFARSEAFRELELLAELEQTDDPEQIH